MTHLKMVDGKKIQKIQQERAEIPFTLYDHDYEHLGNRQGFYFFSFLLVAYSYLCTMMIFTRAKLTRLH